MSLSRGRLPPVINHSTLTYMCHYPGTDCHQSSTIPPWPICVTIQGQTAASHQPFHPGLYVSLSRDRLPPVINHSTLAYMCHYPGGRLPPVINHSTLAYMCHYPGADFTLCEKFPFPKYMLLMIGELYNCRILIQDSLINLKPSAKMWF